MTPLSLVFGLLGLAWGLAADRVAARWPAGEGTAHEDGGVRPVDWRTLAVSALGALALAALPGRFAAVPQLALFTVYFLALVLLLATDLDQRLLPDEITLPLVPLALLAGLVGLDPLVAGRLPLAVVAAVAVPALLFALSIPFGAGAIGIGDLKLLVSVGLLVGLERAVAGVVAGAILSGVVVVLLLVTRRVGLRSFIPFGPFLIAGAFWAVLLPG
ncbi:MAG TPA: prepilin peptidase [Candidatus Limnocylindrales bacterium]